MTEHFRGVKIWVFGLVTVLSLWSPSTWAVERTLSLKQALRLAQSRHVEVLVGDERVRAALARVGQAKSALLPQFDVSASQYRRTVNLETFGINPQIPGFDFDSKPPPFNVFDARIALRQTLFDLSALRAFSAAKVGSRLSQDDRNRAEADALALVAALYLEAHSAHQTWDNTRALVRREEEAYRLAQAQKEIGLGSALAVTQAKSSLAGIRSQVSEAERSAKEKRWDLLAALGLPLETQLRFLEAKQTWQLRAPAEAEIPERIEQHPDILVARRQVELNLQERRREQADYFPKIVGAADFGASGPHPGNSTDTYNFGAGLSIPLYQGGLREARIREASADWRASEIRLEQLRQDREASVLSALAALKQSAETRNAARADLAQSQASLNVDQGRRQSGLGSSFEVTAAQSQVIVAQERLEQAEVAYRLAWVNLEHRLGRMQAWLEEMPES